MNTPETAQSSIDLILEMLKPLDAASDDNGGTDLLTTVAGDHMAIATNMILERLPNLTDSKLPGNQFLCLGPGRAVGERRTVETISAALPPDTTPHVVLVDKYLLPDVAKGWKAGTQVEMHAPDIDNTPGMIAFFEKAIHDKRTFDCVIFLGGDGIFHENPSFSRLLPELLAPILKPGAWVIISPLSDAQEKMNTEWKPLGFKPLSDHRLVNTLTSTLFAIYSPTSP